MLLFSVLLTMSCTRGVPSAAPQVVVPVHIRQVQTEDGWELELRHYPGEGPPVVLMHGMGTNHYNWDYSEEVSLAFYLQSHGWDVWVPSVRGDASSTQPRRLDAGTYSFDDIALYDVPATLAAIKQRSGHEQVYWVGHSMGGMLLYSTLATDPQSIAAGVTISSPASFHDQDTVHQVAAKAGYLVPAHGTMSNRAYYVALDVVFAENPLYQLLSNPENMDPETASGLAQVGLGNMSRGMVKQVQTWLQSGEFLDLQGAHWLQPAQVPVLVMAGSVDRIVPPNNVAAACKVLPLCELRMLGVDAGLSTDYGHIDPVVGRTAIIEIYPQIHTWLSEQSAVLASVEAHPESLSASLPVTQLATGPATQPE